jgi:hypothetical protein
VSTRDGACAPPDPVEWRPRSRCSRGAIPIPTPGWVRSEIPAATIAAIEPGKTTRADVLLALGDPEDRLAGDTGFVYQWAEVLGTVSFWTGVPMAVPVAGMSGDVCHKLVVHFHPTGEVVRAKRFKGQTSFPSWFLGIETRSAEGCTDPALSKQIEEWLAIPGSGPQ